MPRPNPLINPIIDCLAQHPQGISEYLLLDWLRRNNVELPAVQGDADQALFQRHFVVMNALYRLQPHYAEQGLRLLISPLKIELVPLCDSNGSAVAADPAEPKLRAYYLDMSVLDKTDGDGVRAMLDRFWQRLWAGDEVQGALQQLQLDAEASWTQIRCRFRDLAARHHPDRGGDPARFVAVREAYEVLRRLHR
ncbi:DNA-J related domain-containing protein [Motiliproteus sediminis]|uniref:DNA-J related domain-containing protein n=1 Tax=Motiliproteus sediminis TaxID=1468178 RepID=UPI001AEFD3BA|nr:DNA-J related domain-containing protein [Motiliproteus sediminis]